MKKIKTHFKIIFFSAISTFVFSCATPVPEKDALIHNTAVILNQNAMSLSLYNFVTGEYQIDAIALHGGAPRGLFYDSPSQQAYIASSTANHVEVFDIQDNELRYSRSISMPPNCSPYDVHDFGNNDAFYVTCTQNGQFLKISLKNDQIEKTVSGLKRPQSFTLVNNKIILLSVNLNMNSWVYSDGLIEVFDENLNSLEKHTAKGLVNPNDLIVLPGNVLHVLFTGDYASNSTLAVYSINNLSSPQQTVDLGKSGFFSFVRDDNNNVYVLGYINEILQYRPDSLNPTLFFKVADFNNKNLNETPQGMGFYGDSVIISLGDFMNYNDLLIGEKSSIRTHQKRLPASSGTSSVAVFK